MEHFITHPFSLSLRCSISQDTSTGLFLCPSEPASARFGPAFFFYKPCLQKVTQKNVEPPIEDCPSTSPIFQALIVRGTG